eukprot:6349265-Pyramimonas_sp.AAC.1
MSPRWPSGRGRKLTSTLCHRLWRRISNSQQARVRARAHFFCFPVMGQPPTTRFGRRRSGFQTATYVLYTGSPSAPARVGFCNSQMRKSPCSLETTHRTLHARVKGRHVGPWREVNTSRAAIGFRSVCERSKRGRKGGGGGGRKANRGEFVSPKALPLARIPVLSLARTCTSAGRSNRREQHCPLTAGRAKNTCKRADAPVPCRGCITTPPMGKQTAQFGPRRVRKEG